MFKIGHPAYKGINKLDYAPNGEEAVSKLRQRGVEHGEAVEAVRLAQLGSHCIAHVGNDVVEVCEVV